MPPVFVIARLTVQESSRRRLLLALLILTLVVVGFSAWGFNKITTMTRSDGTPLPPDQVSLITSQLLMSTVAAVRGNIIVRSTGRPSGRLSWLPFSSHSRQ